MKRSDPRFCKFFILLVLCSFFGTETPALATDPNQVPVVNIRATDKDASEVSRFWPPVLSGEDSARGGADGLILPDILDTATLSVFRSEPVKLPLVVSYTVSGTAENGVDYVKLSGTVTIPAGEKGARITVVPIDDLLVEDTESVIVTLNEGVCDGATRENCYRVGTEGKAVAFIRDNDPMSPLPPPTPRLTAPQSGSVFEAPATIRIAGYVSGFVDFPKKVEIFEGDNKICDALLGLEPKPLPIVQVDGVLAPVFLVPFSCTWENVPAGGYTLVAVTTDTTGAVAKSNPVEIKVIEKGDERVVVSIKATDPSAAEPDPIPPGSVRPLLLDTATFTVSRTGNADEALDVFYRVSGTAENGVDYQRLSGTVTIAAGARTADIIVSPIDDTELEGTETVIVTVLTPLCLPVEPPPPSCYHVGRPDQAMAFIRDNDRANSAPKVELIRPIDGQVFEGPLDIALFAAASDIDGHVVMVEFFEGDNSIGVARPSPIKPVPPDPVPLPDPRILELERKLPVDVFPRGIFHLNWSDVPVGTYALTAVATDNDGAMSRSRPVMIKVVDKRDPVRPPSVSIVARDPIASEGSRSHQGWKGGTATFVVERRGDLDSELTVYYELGGTAENGVDYEELSRRVTIPAGDRSASIVIVPIDDQIKEKFESVVIGLTIPIDVNPPPYLIKTPGKAAAVILDDDLSKPKCFRLKDKLFHVCHPAPYGLVYRIEATSNFRDWDVVCRNVVIEDQGGIHFVDPDGSLYEYRYYRVVPE